MWFYVENDQQKGPVNEYEFSDLVEKGVVTRTTLVWREGLGDWQLSGQVLPSMPYDVGADEPAPSASYQPPPPGAAPVYTSAPAEDIGDYLILSIVSTLCCCLPAGIVAIVFSVKANNAKKYGDFDTAREASKNARTWALASIAVGLLIGFLYIALGVLTGAAGSY